MDSTDPQEYAIDDLVEKYLLFLRGRGPEPDLSGLPPTRQVEVAEQFKIVAALADRRTELPPLDEDPVAIRLGLALDRPVSEGSGAVPGADSDSDDDPVVVALHELVFRFGAQLVVDLSVAWPDGLTAQVRPVARCTTLGEVIAVCRADVDQWSQEPEDVARLFRMLSDVTAVALVSDDAERAVVVSAADTEHSVDPVHGWISPHNPVPPEPLGIALGRHLDRGLPRWDRVMHLGDLLDLGDLQTTADEISSAQMRSALRTKPRLAYKKEAQQALSATDTSSIASLVVEVQTGRLPVDEVVDRVGRLAGAGAT